MAVVYSLAVRNARLQVVANAIDAGPGNGLLLVKTAGGNMISTIVLDKPCGVVAGGVLTFSGLPRTDPGAAFGGVAALGQLADSTGLVVADGLTITTAGGGGDIIISQNPVNAGDVVSLIAISTITGN